MRTCGISFSGSEAPLVILNDEGIHVLTTVKKIKLHGTTAEDLRAFKALFESFARDERVDVFVVRQPATKGQQRAGADAIRMDTLVRLAEGSFAVETVAPQTIAAKFKKAPFERPQSVAAFQEDAYRVAKLRAD